MTAQDLLAQLERSGVVVSVAGDRLHVEAPRGVLTDNLRQLLAEHKPELIAALAGGECGWPPESLDSQHRFGHAAARLYPFVGKVVSTSRGPGRLLQVFPERATVVLDGEPEHPRVFLPSEVRPLGASIRAEEPFEAVH